MIHIYAAHRIDSSYFIASRTHAHLYVHTMICDAIGCNGRRTTRTTANQSRNRLIMQPCMMSSPYSCLATACMYAHG